MEKNKFKKIENRKLSLGLQDSNLRLKNVIESTDVGTWEWDIQTDEIILSDRWAEITGYDLSEFGPVNLSKLKEVIHPDDFEKSRELLSKHFCGESPYYKNENRIKHKNGHWVWICERGCVTVWSPDGKPLAMFGTHTDITKRKQTERALENYINTLNHDLRSPLSIINGYSSFLLEGEISPENVKKFSKIINSTGKKMLKMMESYLLLAKIERGNDILGKKPRVVIEVVDEIKKIFSEMKNGGGELKLTLKDLEDKCPSDGFIQKTILTDEILFDSLINNLLQNAIEARAQFGGEIVVNVYENDGLCLSFFNQGEISKEIQKKLFKKFASNKKHGTGIGLYSVRLIARAHRGDVHYQFVPGGTRFIVKIPFS